MLKRAKIVVNILRIKTLTMLYLGDTYPRAEMNKPINAPVEARPMKNTRYRKKSENADSFDFLLGEGDEDGDDVCVALDVFKIESMLLFIKDVASSNKSAL
jgi:hypothetical protein